MALILSLGFTNLYMTKAKELIERVLVIVRMSS